MTLAEFKILAQKHGIGLWYALKGAQAKRAVTAVMVLFALPIFGVLTAFGVSSDSQLDLIERRQVIENLVYRNPKTRNPRSMRPRCSAPAIAYNVATRSRSCFTV